MKTEFVQTSLKTSPIFVRLTNDPPLNSKTEFEKGFVISPMHLHDETEVLSVLDGKLLLSTPNKQFIVNKGESVMICERVPHETAVAEKGRFSHSFIQFMPDNFLSSNVNYLYKFLNLNDIYIFKNTSPVSEEAHLYLNNIYREYQNKTSAYETYILGNLQLFLACLYRNGILNNPNTIFDTPKIEKIMPLLKFVNENYSDCISIEFASDMLNLNPDYFCRLFKKITTMTFTDYLNLVRVYHSEKLLTFSDKSIAEISLDTGFASISYFNRVFKKYKSVTPSEYRRSKYKINH